MAFLPQTAEPSPQVTRPRVVNTSHLSEPFSLLAGESLDVSIEFVTSKGGAASPEARFVLSDRDGNVLSTTPLLHAVGDAMLFQTATGDIVARVPASGTYSSPVFEIPVPVTAPDQLRLALVIDSLYYNHGRDTQVAMPGLTGGVTVNLVDTTYSGVIDSVAPETSDGSVPISIAGRALSTADSTPVPFATLKLMVLYQGFIRSYDVVTGADGSFAHLFEPLPGEAGTHTAKVAHPRITSVPLDGRNFVILRTYVSPTSFQLGLPYDTPYALTVKATNSEGTSVNNLALLYRPVDQPDGIPTTGVSITLPASVNLGSGESRELQFTVSADSTAPAAATLVLALVKGESQELVDRIVINATFSESKPLLDWSPSHIETGMYPGAIQQASVKITNRGLATLPAASIELRAASGGAAVPSWARLVTPASLGEIKVGDIKTIELAFTPPDDGSIAPGTWFSFELTVSGTDMATVAIPVHALVAPVPDPAATPQETALFKITDIYTATPQKTASGEIVTGSDGQPVIIQGLQSATVKLEHQTIDLTRSAATDQYGECVIGSLAPGFYKYTATAQNHDSRTGSLWVLPGIQSSTEVFLPYQTISVEWEVNEIAVQDSYSVNLSFTYEVKINTSYAENAPAAVVVMAPAAVNLPPMEPGDVFQGEVTLTNYGLLRAYDISLRLPVIDGLSYEFLDAIPATLESKQRIVIPYKITATASNSGQAGGTDNPVVPKACSPLITLYSYCSACQKFVKAKNVGIICTSGYWTSKAVYNAAGSIASLLANLIQPAATVIVAAQSVAQQVVSTINKIVEVVTTPSQKSTEPKDTECVPQIDCNDTCDECEKNCPNNSNSGGNNKGGNNSGSGGGMMKGLCGKKGGGASGGGGRGGGSGGSCGGLEGKSGTGIGDSGVLNYNCEKIGPLKGKWPSARQHSLKNNSAKNFRGSSGAKASEEGVSIKSIYYQGRGVRMGILEETVSFTTWSPPTGVKYDALPVTVVTVDGFYKYKLPENSPCNPSVKYVTGSSGAVAQWTFPRPGEAVYVSDTGNSTISWLADGTFKLTQADGKWRLYDSSGRLASFGDRVGTTAVIMRDANGVATSVDDVSGQRMLTISTAGDVSTLTDPDGRSTTVTRDALGRVTEIRRPLSPTRDLVDAFEYDEKGRMTKLTSPGGGSHTFQYHPSGRVKTLTDKQGGTTSYSYEYDDTSGLFHTTVTRPSGDVGESWFDSSYRARKSTLNGVQTSKNYQDKTKKVSIDRNGNATTKWLDEFGNVIRITHPDGSEERNEYDRTKYNSLVRHIDANLVETVYERDSLGNITRGIRAKGTANEQVTEYAYGNADFPSLTTSITRKGSGGTPDAVTTYEYDDYGRLVKTTDPEGATTEILAYDSMGDVLQVKDSAGNVTSHEYNLLGWLVKTTNPDGSFRTFDYDDMGQQISTTDELGDTTSYEFDDYGRPVRTTYPDGSTIAMEYDFDGLLTSTTDQLGNATTMRYDSLGRLVRRTDPAGQSTKYFFDGDEASDAQLNQPYKIEYPTYAQYLVYDKMGRNVKTLDYLDAATPVATSLVYDPTGLVTETTDRRGLVVKIEYDALGRPVRTFDQFGNTTERTYDAHGDMISTKSYSSSDSSMATTVSYQYDRAGRQTMAIDQRGRASTTEYDAAGRPVKQTAATGLTVKYAYDNRNRPATVSYYVSAAAANPFRTVTNTYNAAGQRLAMADSLGSTVTWTYDSMGRKLTEATTFSSQTFTRSWTYYADGSPRTMTEPNGSVTTFEYDALRRITKTTLVDETYSTAAYGAHGPKNQIDRAGRITSYEYDAFGRRVKIINPKSEVISFSYSPAGDLLKLTDANGSQTSWEYDARGLVTKKIYADGSFYTYSYYPEGRLQSRTDALGKVTNYSYNQFGQLTTIDYPNDTDVVFGYDEFGRRNSMSDASGSTAWTYDAFDRVATEADPFTGVLGYTYNDLGQKTAMSLNVGAIFQMANISYSYDPMGRMASVSSGADTFAYSYVDVSRKIDKLALNTNTVVENHYDVLGRLTNKINKNPSGAVVSSYAYELDNADQRVKVTFDDGRFIAYGYDPVGQLISAKRFLSNGDADPSYVSGFAYDPMGNRQSATDAGSTISYNTNSLNQYTEIFNPDGSASQPSYDANGNILQANGFVLAWDDENRLASATKENDKRYEFVYDGQSRRRIKKSFNWNGSTWNLTNERRYVYDGWNLVAELDAANNVVNTYAWGIDLSGSEQGAGGVGGLLSVNHLGSTYYANYGGNGNVTRYVDSTGNVSYSCSYSPFGEAIEETGSKPCSFGFSTKYTDEETGLVYYGYRYYEPETGRWLGRDPLTIIGGLLALSEIDDKILFVNNIKDHKTNIHSIVYIAMRNNPICHQDYLGLLSPCKEYERDNKDFIDEGDIGGTVVCEGGVKYACSFELPGTHIGLMLCTLQHEKAHMSALECNKCGVYAAEWKKGMTENDKNKNECEAYKLNNECIKRHMNLNCGNLRYADGSRSKCEKEFEDGIEHNKDVMYNHYRCQNYGYEIW